MPRGREVPGASAQSVAAAKAPTSRNKSTLEPTRTHAACSSTGGAGGDRDGGIGEDMLGGAVVRPAFPIHSAFKRPNWVAV